jgi:hypothetical protein
MDFNYFLNNYLTEKSPKLVHRSSFRDGNKMMKKINIFNLSAKKGIKKEKVEKLNMYNTFFKYKYATSKIKKIYEKNENKETTEEEDIEYLNYILKT